MEQGVSLSDSGSHAKQDLRLDCYGFATFAKNNMDNDLELSPCKAELQKHLLGTS